MESSIFIMLRSQFILFQYHSHNKEIKKKSINLIHVLLLLLLLLVVVVVVLFT